MKELANEVDRFVQELDVIREVGRIESPVTQGKRPFVYRIRPVFLLGLIAAGGMIAVGVLKVVSHLNRKK